MKRLLQVCWLAPAELVVLARVEVNVDRIAVTACPDNRYVESLRVACLKVDAWLLLGQVGDYETTALDFKHDSVVDAFRMVEIVDTERGVASGLDGGLDAFAVQPAQLWSEAHRDERLPRGDGCGFELSHPLPTSEGEAPHLGDVWVGPHLLVALDDTLRVQLSDEEIEFLGFAQ